MSIRNIPKAIKKKIKNANYKKIINKRLPITYWLPRYTIGKLLQDLLAGFSVSLTKVPQGIAQAVIAGLDPQYGLYSGFMGCFVYVIFGSCKDVNVGPTAIMALMVQPHVVNFGPDGAILLAFINGCIVFLLGALNLGLIVQFFSYPVVTGFTSAAALQIGSTQMPNLFGIPIRVSEFLESWITVFENLDLIALWDLLMGVIAIIILLSMKQLTRLGNLKGNPNWSRTRNNIGRFLWLLALARNALVVTLCSLMAYILDINGHRPFRLTGEITQGLPPFRPPNFEITYNNVTHSTGEILSSFGTTIAFLPLNTILGAVAIAKAFSKGKPVDATQEMIAVGLSNILGSFVSSIPVTGSFTRTAVNNASGVRTPMGGIVTGTIIILALILLTASFYYIPRAVLAAVIIAAMVNLFEYEAIFVLWKSRKIDLLLHFITLIACLFLGLEYGLLIGIAVNLLFVMYSALRPPISIQKEELHKGSAFVVTPPKAIHYPAAEYLCGLISKKCCTSVNTIIVNGENIKTLDATVAKNLKTLTTDLTARGQNIIFLNFKNRIKNICVGIDPIMEKHFINGSIEDVFSSKMMKDEKQI